MRDEARTVAAMWGISVLAVIVAIPGLIYLVRGGLDYPAFSTASWFVTLTIILGMLLVVACLWNGWYMLTRGLTDRELGPLPEPAWIGALVSLALAVALGIVVFRMPGSGIGRMLANCPARVSCFLDYGNARTELGVAALAFLLDGALFGTVAAWATSWDDDGDDE